MKRQVIVCLAGMLILVCHNLAHGSSWSLLISSLDYIKSIQQTADGGYIVAAQAVITTSNDTSVLKLNADGSVAWQKTYGGSSGNEWGTSIQQTADGGYIVAGSTTSFGAGGNNAWVLKLNEDGSIVWQKTYGGPGYDILYSIQQTADGGYIAAGFTNSDGSGRGNDALVVKLNADGSVAWQNIYGGTRDDVAESVQQTADGGYLVAGGTQSSGAGTCDAWVVKLNVDGSVAWQKSYGGPGYDIFNSIQQTTDGGYIVAGVTQSFGAGSGDAWVLKLNSDGSVAWQKTYGGSDSDDAESIQKTADGGYIVAGSTYSSLTRHYKARVMKLNADGSVAWQKTYGGLGDDEAIMIQQSADGGYIVAGQTSSFGTAGDSWVLKLDQKGGIMGCSSVIISASAVTQSSTNATPVDSYFVPVAATITSASTSVTPVSSNAAAVTNCSYTPSPAKWQKTYGGSGYVYGAYSVQQTSDGGYIIAGYTATLGTSDDVLVLKLKADGSVAWQKAFGGPGNEFANAIHQTADGGYIVAATTNSFGAGGYDAWVLKLDKDGNVAWQKTYGGPGDELASSIQQTADVGYIVAGHTGFGAGNADAWVLKLNSDGSVAWQKTYGGIRFDYANSIQQTSDGGFIVAGETFSFGAGGTDTNVWVLKLNSDGSVAWQMTYGGSSNDGANSIRQTADGGYIVAGYTHSEALSNDAWVLKLNSDGSVAWQKTYGGSGDDYAYSIQQAADGGYIDAGYTDTFGAGGTDVWVLKLNSDGSVAWQKTYGGSDHDKANSVQQTADGGYIVAGYTDSFSAGREDVWVLKLDQNGGITGCANIAASTALEQNSSGTVSSSTVSPVASSATVGTSTATVNSAAVTPGTTCSANYNQYLLELLITGPGTGRVISNPSGINCTTDCSYPFSSGAVTLTELSDPQASFTGWSGACNTSGQVTMEADKRCYAGFSTPADFIGAPRYGYLPLMVNFSDLSTNNPTHWAWDFGDSDTASGSSASHIYRLPGMYTVSLITTGDGGGAQAKKVDYVTAAPCANKPARITGPQYYASVAEAYSHLGGSGSIDLLATEFTEDVEMSSAKTVTLNGGYPCGYGARIADSIISGSLTIGGSSGAVTFDRITIH